MKAKSQAHALLEIHLKELGWGFTPEFCFFPPRRWRFDYMLGNTFVAIEIEGGGWIYGRHNRTKGWLRDMEKYRVAAAMGYQVLRFTPEEVLNGTAKEFIADWFPRKR